MDTSTTFKVADVKVERVTNLSVAERTAYSKSRASICSEIGAFERSHCSEILSESRFSPMVQPSRNNGFLNTVITCYNNHHNLVIRPDDIWTAIMTQFSFYISRNVEELRTKQFFHFEVEKELILEMVRSGGSATYNHFLTSIKEEIDKIFMSHPMKHWIFPKFTTTTANDIISCGIAFMATTKKSFDFVCRKEGINGIPYVTLGGTTADWENILNRLDKLKTFKISKLQKWHEMLRPILSEFVAAKKNEENVEFWNRIIHHHRLSTGSGPSLMNGWLTAFAVFNEDGKDCVDLESFCSRSIDCEEKAWPLIETDRIPSGCVTVNVKFVDGDKKTREGIVFAGHIAHEIREDDFTIQPQTGWGMALRSTTKEIETLHETARRNGDFKCDSCKTFFEKN